MKTFISSFQMSMNQGGPKQQLFYQALIKKTLTDFKNNSAFILHYMYIRTYVVTLSQYAHARYKHTCT